MDTRTPSPSLYLAHANALKEDLSAAESLRFWRKLSGHATSAGEIDAALEHFAMASRRDALGRTRSRKGSAGASPWLAWRSRAMLRPGCSTSLSTPSSTPHGIATLDALLRSHARRGGSVVLTSHVPLTIDDPLPLEVMLESPVAA